MNEIEIRKLLLDFYSNELNTHSRLITGFSVILFTLFGVIQKINENEIYAQIIACFPFFLVSFSLWYLFFRHFFYGILANACIMKEFTKEELIDTGTAERAVANLASKRKILHCVPFEWFRRKKKNGVTLCIVFSFFTVILLLYIISCQSP